MKPENGPQSLLFFYLKTRLISIGSTGPQHSLVAIHFFITGALETWHCGHWTLSAIIKSSYGDSTDSLLAHEDWIPQLYEWPLLHSSLLCSAPAEMQPRERIWKAERQTPSSWDHCLGINLERHLHIKGPENHSEPKAWALQTSTTQNLWVTPQTEANKNPSRSRKRACI